MNIQNVPFIKIAEKDGTMTDEFRRYLSEIAQLLQQNLSDDGYTPPTRDRAEILSDLNNTTYESNILYTSDKKLVVNINGTFQQINTSPY